MELVLTLIIGLILGMIIGGAIGYLLASKPKPHTIKPMSEEEEKKQRKEQDHFNGLMNYDAKQAYGGK